MRVGLDAAMKHAYAAMSTRLEQRAAMPDSIHDTKNNPLPVTSIPPGGGKSFFLDQLGALHQRDLEEFCDNTELRTILRNSVSTNDERKKSDSYDCLTKKKVAVPITFNSASPPQDAESKFTPGGSVALRALYRYWVRGTQ
jgi:hypothetical protein